MKRSYYSATSKEFKVASENSILGELSRHHSFALEDLQKNAWLSQIKILKDQISLLPNSYIAFEFIIPRMGKRIDIIILYKGLIFAIEFKVGEKNYPQHALDQVYDYSLDLKNFHEQSHKRHIIPILISTNAPKVTNTFTRHEDKVLSPIKSNSSNWAELINSISKKYLDDEINHENWMTSVYKPTPTIIEAAQALYKNHSVDEITRSDSGAINLAKTSKSITKIIDKSKENNRKAICFITGVPGAGKTLAGLNIANLRHNVAEEEHAVFLSGNGPLVEVLQEALARDEVEENKLRTVKLKKTDALRKTKSFIQNIHHFRDDAIANRDAPAEKVAIFDEAQRAWTQEKTSSFMKQKKGIADFEQSEPEFLMSVLDRHEDWATIICLIGGGQEINTGEAGLPEWFNAISKSYKHWDVYISDKLTAKEYNNGEDIHSLLSADQCSIIEELHLSVSIRSFRSEILSEFVKSIIDIDKILATKLLPNLLKNYPLAITRNLDAAKSWLIDHVRGSEKAGIIASSGALRLKPYGINIKADIDCKHWFLNDKEDIRSSNFLEDVATEFTIQGLELDWICVAWDANLRLQNGQWQYKNFSGTKWNNINSEVRQRYLRNAYRVLLTRARQGMVIFIPPGNASDNTRLPEFYNELYEYFKKMGITEI